MANLKTERERLEAAYYKASLPPWKLIYRILIFGTAGVCCAVLTARTIVPNKIPHLKIVYPNQ